MKEYLRNFPSPFNCICHTNQFLIVGICHFELDSVDVAAEQTGKVYDLS